MMNKDIERSGHSGRTSLTMSSDRTSVWTWSLFQSMLGLQKQASKTCLFLLHSAQSPFKCDTESLLSHPQCSCSAHKLPSVPQDIPPGAISDCQNLQDLGLSVLEISPLATWLLQTVSQAIPWSASKGQSQAATTGISATGLTVPPEDIQANEKGCHPLAAALYSWFGLPSRQGWGGQRKVSPSIDSPFQPPKVPFPSPLQRSGGWFFSPTTSQSLHFNFMHRASFGKMCFNISLYSIFLFPW